MKLSERDYWMALGQSPGIGLVRFDHILQHFGSAQKAWESADSVWKDGGFRGQWVEHFLSFRRNFLWEQVLSKLDANHVRWVARCDDDFPKNLTLIDRAPIGLYAQGVWSDWDSLVLLAVVGTRNITDYGRDVTRTLVTGVVGRSVGIVSGLMYGVDEVAHRSCLDVGGYTVGVWAGGLDTFSGAQRKLAQDIINSGGLLVSEYPLGLAPSVQTFPARNRIVAGLAKGVLVTEGSAASGTLITAGFAAEQGKSVMAVPGQIMSSQSVAPAQLIRSGATLVSCVEDIFDELGMKKGPSVATTAISWSNEAEALVGKMLASAGLISADELRGRLQMPLHILLGHLTMMELRGLVQKNKLGEWRLVQQAG